MTEIEIRAMVRAGLEAGVTLESVRAAADGKKDAPKRAGER
jgi:hypothetical protein